MVKRSRPQYSRDRVFNALPGTTTEISARAHVDLRCVSRYLRALADEGLAHVSAIQEGGMRRRVIWSVGPAPEGGPAFVRKERRREAERRKTPRKNTHAHYLDTRREDETIERVKASPANWLSSLFVTLESA